MKLRRVCRVWAHISGADEVSFVVERHGAGRGHQPRPGGHHDVGVAGRLDQIRNGQVLDAGHDAPLEVSDMV
jgi:hypothetical protein